MTIGRGGGEREAVTLRKFLLSASIVLIQMFSMTLRGERGGGGGVNMLTSQ